MKISNTSSTSSNTFQPQASGSVSKFSGLVMQYCATVSNSPREPKAAFDSILLPDSAAQATGFVIPPPENGNPISFQNCAAIFSPDELFAARKARYKEYLRDGCNPPNMAQAANELSRSGNTELISLIAALKTAAAGLLTDIERSSLNALEREKTDTLRIRLGSLADILMKELPGILNAVRTPAPEERQKKQEERKKKFEEQLIKNALSRLKSNTKPEQTAGEGIEKTTLENEIRALLASPPLRLSEKLRAYYAFNCEHKGVQASCKQKISQIEAALQSATEAAYVVENIPSCPDCCNLNNPTDAHWPGCRNRPEMKKLIESANGLLKETGSLTDQLKDRIRKLYTPSVHKIRHQDEWLSSTGLRAERIISTGRTLFRNLGKDLLKAGNTGVNKLRHIALDYKAVKHLSRFSSVSDVEKDWLITLGLFINPIVADAIRVKHIASTFSKALVAAATDKVTLYRPRTAETALFDELTSLTPVTPKALLLHAIRTANDALQDIESSPTDKSLKNALAEAYPDKARITERLLASRNDQAARLDEIIRILRKNVKLTETAFPSEGLLETMKNVKKAASAIRITLTEEFERHTGIAVKKSFNVLRKMYGDIADSWTSIISLITKLESKYYFHPLPEAEIPSRKQQIQCILQAAILLLSRAEQLRAVCRQLQLALVGNEKNIFPAPEALKVAMKKGRDIDSYAIRKLTSQIKRLLERVTICVYPKHDANLGESVTREPVPLRILFQQAACVLQTVANDLQDAAWHASYPQGKQAIQDMLKDILLQVESIRKGIKDATKASTGQLVHINTPAGLIAKDVGQWLVVLEKNWRRLTTDADFTSFRKKVIADLVQEFGERSDPSGVLFRSRVELAYQDAKNGDIAWPLTPEQILNGIKTETAYLLSWAEKRISYSLVLSLLFYGTLAALFTPTWALAAAASPLRWFHLFLTPFRLAMTKRSLEKVRPGQSLPTWSIKEYLKREDFQTACRILSILSPSLCKTLAASGITIYGVVEDKAYREGYLKRGLERLPGDIFWAALTTGMGEMMQLISLEQTDIPDALLHDMLLELQQSSNYQETIIQLTGQEENRSLQTSGRRLKRALRSLDGPVYGASLATPNRHTEEDAYIFPHILHEQQTQLIKDALVIHPLKDRTEGARDFSAPDLKRYISSYPPYALVEEVITSLEAKKDTVYFFAQLLSKPIIPYGTEPEKTLTFKQAESIVADWVCQTYFETSFEEYVRYQIFSIYSNTDGLSPESLLNELLKKIRDKISDDRMGGMRSPETLSWLRDHVMSSAPAFVIQIQNPQDTQNLTLAEWGQLNAGALLLQEYGIDISDLTVKEVMEVGHLTEHLITERQLPPDTANLFSLPALVQYYADNKTPHEGMDKPDTAKMQQIYQHYFNFLRSAREQDEQNNPILRFDKLYQQWLPRKEHAREILTQNNIHLNQLNDYLEGKTTFVTQDNRPVTLPNLNDLVVATTQDLGVSYRDGINLMLSGVFETLPPEEKRHLISANISRVKAEFKPVSRVLVPPIGGMGSTALTHADIPVQTDAILLQSDNDKERRIYALKLNTRAGGYQLSRVDNDKKAYFALTGKSERYCEDYIPETSKAKALKQSGESLDTLSASLARWLHQEFVEQLNKLNYPPTPWDKTRKILLSIVPFYTCIDESLKGNEDDAILACTADVAGLLPFAGQAARTGTRFSLALGKATTSAVRYGTRHLNNGLMKGLREGGKHFYKLSPSIAKEISPGTIKKLAVSFAEGVSPPLTAEAFRVIKYAADKIPSAGRGLIRLANLQESPSGSRGGSITTRASSYPATGLIPDQSMAEKVRLRTAELPLRKRLQVITTEGLGGKGASRSGRMMAASSSAYNPGLASYQNAIDWHALPASQKSNYDVLMAFIKARKIKIDAPELVMDIKTGEFNDKGNINIARSAIPFISFEAWHKINMLFADNKATQEALRAIAREYNLNEYFVTNMLAKEGGKPNLIAWTMNDIYLDAKRNEELIQKLASWSQHSQYGNQKEMVQFCYDLNFGVRQFFAKNGVLTDRGKELLLTRVEPDTFISWINSNYSLPVDYAETARMLNTTDALARCFINSDGTLTSLGYRKLQNRINLTQAQFQALTETNAKYVAEHKLSDYKSLSQQLKIDEAVIKLLIAPDGSLTSLGNLYQQSYTNMPFDKYTIGYNEGLPGFSEPGPSGVQRSSIEEMPPPKKMRNITKKGASFKKVSKAKKIAALQQMTPRPGVIRHTNELHHSEILNVAPSTALTQPVSRQTLLADGTPTFAPMSKAAQIKPSHLSGAQIFIRQPEPVREQLPSLAILDVTVSGSSQKRLHPFIGSNGSGTEAPLHTSNGNVYSAITLAPSMSVQLSASTAAHPEQTALRSTSSPDMLVIRDDHKAKAKKPVRILPHGDPLLRLNNNRPILQDPLNPDIRLTPAFNPDDKTAIRWAGLRDVFMDMNTEDVKMVKSRIKAQLKTWFEREGAHNDLFDKNLELGIPVDELPSRGIGVFAKRNIPAFTVLGPYAGKLLMRTGQSNEPGSLAYAYRKTGVGKVNRTMWECSKHYAVDGSETGNILQYVNTGQLPGELRIAEDNVAIIVINKQIVMYVTIREIGAGEELLVSYGDTYDPLGERSGNREATMTETAIKTEPDGEGYLVTGIMLPHSQIKTEPGEI